MKTVVVYYSLTGNNEKLADLLASQLRCPVARIVEKRKRGMMTLLREMLTKKLPDIMPLDDALSGCGNAVLVSPVWGGFPASPMMAFMKRYAARITRYSFVTLCGGSLGPNARLPDFLSRTMGRSPEACVELYVNDAAPAQARGKPMKIMGITLSAGDLEEKYGGRIKDLVSIVR